MEDPVRNRETTALQAQLSRVSILNRRMDASVLLVKALGGGWRTVPLFRIDASAEGRSRSRPVGDQPAEIVVSEEWAAP